MSEPQRIPPSMIHAALYYARAGFAVFPLRPGAKVPLTEHGCLDATRDEATIRDWWSRWRDANIGIAAGVPSGGVWVLDVDGAEGEQALLELETRHGELPVTLEARTSRGRHLYLRVPEGVELPKNSAKRLPKLDTRATGGYVVAPPSAHPDGSRYEWAEGRGPRDIESAVAPAWLLEAFATKKPSPARDVQRPPALPPSTARDIRRKWCLGALEAEARELAAAPAGTRNDKLNSAAYKIGGYVGAGHLEESEVEHVLLGACSSWPDRDERKDVDTLRRGLKAGTEQPRALPPDVEARAYRHALDDAKRAAQHTLRDAWARVEMLEGEQRMPGLETQARRLRELIASGALDARTVTGSLEDAADRCGLVDATSWTEVRTAIARGLGVAPPHPLNTPATGGSNGGPPAYVSGGDEPPPHDPLPDAPGTELGVGAAFAQRLEGEAIYVEEENGWLLYEAGAWQRDRRERVRELCSVFLTELRISAAASNDKDAAKLLLRLSAARGIDAILRVASSRPEVRRLHEQLDASPDLLNCENGTIDLRTGVLRPHDARDLLTRMAPSKYEPEIAADDFAKLLEQLAPDPDARAYLQRAIGYSITGHVTEDAVFLLVGPPRCGKSSLAHAARGALGTYFAGAKMESFCVITNAGGNAARSDLVRLRHGRLVVASEVKPGLALDNGLLKALAGGEGEAFPFREVYGREFTARWIGKVWLVCNDVDVPKMRSDDDAFWERAKRIPVGTTVAQDKRDTGFRQRLEHDPTVRSAFLGWAVQGAMQWRAQAGLGEPPSVRAASASLRDEMDAVAIWCAERLVFDPHARCSKKHLREFYEKACEETGDKPVGSKRFAASLAIAGRRAGVEVSVTTMRVLDKVVGAWAGARPATDDEFEKRGVLPHQPPPPQQGDLGW